MPIGADNASKTGQSGGCVSAGGCFPTSGSGWLVFIFYRPLSRMPSSGVGSLHGGTGFRVS